MQPANVLEVKDLQINFTTSDSTVEAVKGISFQLKKGKVLGIVGESGSGKSATSLAIMGLLPKAGKVVNGEILFQLNDDEAVDLAKQNNRQLAAIRGSKIAMVFQEPMTALNPVFKVGQQVVEAILQNNKSTKQEAKKEVIELFEKVKLADPHRIFNAYPHQLSGGQRQRVMIAMALSGNPSILIADEPTSALDVTVQQSIIDLLNEIKSSWGGSILFISHDLAVVASIADDVLVMKNGAVIEEGNSKQIFSKPKEAYTIDLVKDSKFESLRPRDKIQKESRNKILEITALSKIFPIKKSLLGKAISHTKAVDEVSFSIFEGETLGLVGESGSGKTTLGRTMLKLQDPTQGAVIYDGENLFELKDDEWKKARKELQIIFQDPYSSLNPKMTIGEAIQEPMKVHDIWSNDTERKENSFLLLEKVGLEKNHYWRYPKEFSGGQRQRICIARAIASQPRFLICDECVSALDVTVQAKIINLLQDLQDEFGLTYLFISHDLNLVKKISDRIAIMKNGKILEMGYSEEVYKNPQHPYTAQLIQSIPNLL